MKFTFYNFLISCLIVTSLAAPAGKGTQRQLSQVEMDVVHMLQDNRQNLQLSQPNAKRLDNLLQMMEGQMAKQKGTGKRQLSKGGMGKMNKGENAKATPTPGGGLGDTVGGLTGGGI